MQKLWVIDGTIFNDKNVKNIVLINNSRTSWRTKILMRSLSFIDNLLQDAYIRFQNSVDDFKKTHTTCSILVKLAVSPALLHTCFAKNVASKERVNCCYLFFLRCLHVYKHTWEGKNFQCRITWFKKKYMDNPLGKGSYNFTLTKYFTPC